MKTLKILEFCVVLFVLGNVKNTNGHRLSNIDSWTNTLSSFNGVETIQVGGRNLPEEELIRQAVAAGMDRGAVSELLSTLQPVITTDTDAKGVRRTTTYNLTDDGAIIRRTETEEATPLSLGIRNSFETIRPSEAVPDSKTSAASNPDNDWELTPARKSNTPTFTYGSNTPSFFDFGKSFGKGSDDPFNPHDTTTDTRTIPTSWSTRSWINRPDVDLPPGVTPKTTTKTEVDDQGRRVTTTLTTYSNIPADQWPKAFDKNFPSLFNDDQWRTQFSGFPDRPSATHPREEDQPQTTTTPRTKLLSFDEWKALHYATSTTTQKPQTSFEDSGSNVNFRPRVGVVLRPEPPTVPTRRTTTYVPSVSDILNTQYGSNTPIHTFDLDKVTPSTNTINIDELPATRIPSKSTPKIQNEIKPLIDDVWLRNLATSDVEILKSSPPATSESSTKISTLSQTLNSARPLRIADLEPSMQQVLLKSGFTDDDLQNSNGNSVSKTVVDANGHSKTTTVHIRTVPSTVDSSLIETGRQSPRRDEHKRQQRALFSNFETNHVKPFEIDRYLARVNLTAEEIAAKNGIVTHTLVEDNGRILSATFVLSTTKGNTERVQAPTPLK